MVLTSANVRVGVTGAAYTAPPGTALPTDAGTALDPAFEDVGYISDDGVTESQDTDVTNIKAWQNSDVVRKVQTEHDVTYNFTMIETNPVSLEAYYGNFAAADPGATPPTDDTVEITGEQLPRGPWVLSVLDGADVIRVSIPDGQVTERGEITYQGEEEIGYEITITCYPDTSGVKAYKYME